MASSRSGAELVGFRLSVLCWVFFSFGEPKANPKANRYYLQINRGFASIGVMVYKIETRGEQTNPENRKRTNK
jgi:hypothetical protein